MDASTLEDVTLDSPAPADITPELWERLTGALRAALEARVKAAAAVPMAEETRVADFVIVADAQGLAQSNWSFIFKGDYNRNGKVGVDDLPQIAFFYGVASTSHEWLNAQLADGNGDGRIDINDVTPIGMHYGETVSGFEIQQSSTPEETGAWTMVQQVPYHTRILREPYSAVYFMQAVPGAQAGMYYRIVPYFMPAQGAASYGLPSKAMRYFGKTSGAGSWPMDGHDAQRTYRGEAPGPNSARVRWIYRDEDLYRNSESASPLIANDGALYLTSANGLIALQPDGSLRWRLDLQASEVVAGALAPDGTLCLRCLTSDGKCLKAVSPGGIELWSRPIRGRLGQPMLAQDALLFASAEGFEAYSLEGKALWFLATDIDPGASTWTAIQTTNGNVVFGDQTSRYALTPAGVLAWKTESARSIMRQLAAFSDGGFAVSPGSGIIDAYTNDGEMQWSVTGLYCGSNIALASDNSLRCTTSTQLPVQDVVLSALRRDGSLLFNAALPAGCYSAQVLIDSQERTYVIGLTTDYTNTDMRYYIIYCINDSGNVVWHYSVSTASHSLCAASLGADGGLYILGQDELLCLRDDGYALPEAPQAGASAGAYCDHVNVVWTAIANTDTYRIYRDGGTFPLGEVTGTQYDDYGVIDGSFHKYTVSGVNVLGEGAASVPAMGRIKDYPGGDYAGGDWAMMGHDERHTFRSNIAGPSNPGLKWVRQLGEPSLDKIYMNSIACSQHNYTYVSGTSGTIYAIDPEGNDAWRMDLGEDVSPPAVGADGTIYCAASEKQSAGGEDPTYAVYFYAINPNRTIKWRFASITSIEYPMAHSAPTIDSAGNIHCILYANEAIKLSPEGALLQDTLQEDSRNCFFVTAPAIGPEGNSYSFRIINSLIGSLWALDPSGATLWNQTGDINTAGYASGIPSIYADGRIICPGMQSLIFAPDGSSTALNLNAYFSNFALTADNRAFCVSKALSGICWLDADESIHTLVTADVKSIENSLILDGVDKIYCAIRSNISIAPLDIYCYTPAGDLLWSYTIDDYGYIPFLALRDDGALLVLTGTSLYCFADQ